MKVKNLVANDWCPGCKKAKGYTYTLPGLLGAYDNDPDAVELPETCSCDGAVPALPVDAPAVVVHGQIPEEILRTMVRNLVAEQLAGVREVPLD